MKIYTGRPANRFGYAIEGWVWTERPDGGRIAKKELPACVHQEIKRIWGVSIGGWFIGVQRVELQRKAHP